nr:tyrosine-type recombinase/integrase [Geomicrobium halophilum]
MEIVRQPITDVIMTFDEALDRFLADGERKGLRSFTIEFYRKECHSFRKYLINAEHSMLIGEITRNHIDQFVEDLQIRRRLKPGTINAKLRAIRTFFNYLHDYKFIEANPMQKYPLMKERRSNVETLTTSQVKRLLNAPDLRTFTGQRDYTFLLLVLETGVRLNEAAGMLVEDVKLSEGQIFVRNTKNHFHRYVPIQEKMKQQLKRYIQLRGTCETEHLFVTIEEQALSRSHLQKTVKIHGKKAGITNVRLSPHTLRHTFAKMCVMNGAGVFELQKILGHSTMDMVRTYVNLYSQDVHEKHREFSPLKDL